MHIKIFATGGTFDKEYNPLNGELFFRETHLKEMLERGKSKVQVEIRTLMLIDSLFMTATDRQLILENCMSATEDSVVVTHGTDTMVETARVLGEAHIPDKTIVLTGAMVPYTFGSADGLFNLASALAFAQVLVSGVYVAMNGKYFLWNNVRKNRNDGTFEPISE